MFTYNKFVKLSTPKSKLTLLFESADDEIDINDMFDAMDDDQGDIGGSTELTRADEPDEDVDTFEPTEEQIEDYVNSLGEETDIGMVMPKDPELDRLEQMLLQSMKSGSPIIDNRPETLSEDETAAVSNFVERHIEQDAGNTPLTLKEAADECRNIFDDGFVDLMLARVNELIPFCEKHRVTFTDEEKAELFSKLVYVYADPNKKTEQEVSEAEAEMVIEFIKSKHKPITDEEIFKETIKSGAMEAGFQIPFHLISSIIAKRSSKKAYSAFVSKNLRRLCIDIADTNVKQVLKNSGVQISKQAEQELILAARRNLVGQVGEYTKSGGKRTVDSILKFLTSNGSTKTLEFVGNRVQSTSVKVVDAAAKSAIQKSVASAATRKAAQVATKDATKIVAKQAGATMGKSALKKIPIFGIVIGAGFAAMEIWQGGLNTRSLVRAGSQLASGVVSSLPGPGTLASIAIDVALAGEDIYHDLSAQKAEDEKQAVAQNNSEENPTDEFDKLVASI